jgi:hypothetical protein
MIRTQRAHILIPTDLLREIDAIVGRRGRTAFLLETAREEVRRRKLLRFLESAEPAWNDRDHPELGEKSSEWVRNLRAESEHRFAAAPLMHRARKSNRRKPRRG